MNLCTQAKPQVLAECILIGEEGPSILDIGAGCTRGSMEGTPLWSTCAEARQPRVAQNLLCGGSEVHVWTLFAAGPSLPDARTLWARGESVSGPHTKRWCACSVSLSRVRFWVHVRSTFVLP